MAWYGREMPAAVALLREFPDWQIDRPDSGWVAFRRRGSSARVIAAYDLVGLLAKLRDAESQESGHGQ